MVHGFSHASKYAICSTIYVITTTKDGKKVQKRLVVQSGIAPKNQTITRLELVSSLILAKLMAHITDAIYRIVQWVDSMTVLYCLNNKGTWPQYVRNKVKTYQNPSKYWNMWDDKDHRDVAERTPIV